MTTYLWRQPNVNFATFINMKHCHENANHQFKENCLSAISQICKTNALSWLVLGKLDFWNYYWIGGWLKTEVMLCTLRHWPVDWMVMVGGCQHYLGKESWHWQVSEDQDTRWYISIEHHTQYSWHNHCCIIHKVHDCTACKLLETNCTLQKSMQLVEFLKNFKVWGYTIDYGRYFTRIIMLSTCNTISWSQTKEDQK